jgi:hypothetical protein
MQNWEDTLASQYANSPALLAIIEGMNDSIDQTARINDFVRLVWNVDTAQGYGLDVWGRIVGISRYLSIPSTEDFFGFETGGVPEHSMTFGSGVFFAGASSSTAFALSDTAYRQLIYFKAFANIARADIPTLNRLVSKLFAGLHGLYIVRGYIVDGYFSTEDTGRAYVQDLGGMQMRYVFEYDLNIYETAIINTPGLLPHPAGVKVFIG